MSLVIATSPPPHLNRERNYNALRKKIDIWITPSLFHSRTLNNKINRLQRLIYDDKQSTFEELLEKENSVHIRNLQTLAIEMYKIVNGGFSISWRKQI